MGLILTLGSVKAAPLSGKLGIARVPLKLVGRLAHAAPAALEQPPPSRRGLKQRRGSLVGTQGKVARRSLVLEPQHKVAVAVADDRVRLGLAIAGLELAYRLANDGAADLSAADNGKHVIKAG